MFQRASGPAALPLAFSRQHKTYWGPAYAAAMDGAPPFWRGGGLRWHRMRAGEMSAENKRDSGAAGAGSDPFFILFLQGTHRERAVPSSRSSRTSILRPSISVSWNMEIAAHRVIRRKHSVRRALRRRPNQAGGHRKKRRRRDAPLLHCSTAKVKSRLFALHARRSVAKRDQRPRLRRGRPISFSSGFPSFRPRRCASPPIPLRPFPSHRCGPPRARRRQQWRSRESGRRGPS